MSDKTDATEPAERLLRRLADIEAIKALKMRYARFCDAGYDPDGIAGLFVEDGVWDGGELFGRREGRETIREHFRGASKRLPWAMHYILCPHVTVADDGRSARGSWYLWQPCLVARGGEESQAYLAGTYDDTYRKVDGEWLFDQVVIKARWLDAPPATLPG